MYANPASWLIVKLWEIGPGELLPQPCRDAVVRSYSANKTEESTFAAGHVSIRLLFVADPDEKRVYLFGADDTRDRQAEKDLLIKAHAHEQAHDAIVVTDVDFRSVDINPAYTRLTGFTELDALGEAPSFLQEIRANDGQHSSLLQDLKREGHWTGELWDRKKSGELFAASVSMSAVSVDGESVTHYVALIVDITGKKLAEEELVRMAHYDALTGLANRSLFSEHLKNATRHAERMGEELAVMIVDLDGFKAVNDTIGHYGGDKLLQTVARRMAGTLRSSDIIARFGGDEFAVLARDLTDRWDALVIARKLLSAVSETRNIEGLEVSVTASIGVALFPHDQTAIEPLLQKADMAMYQAKQRGKNGVRFCDDDVHTVPFNPAPFQITLRRAVDEGNVKVAYQPQFGCGSGELSGVEAVARWTDEHGRAVPPEKFIPVAEEYGLISSVGELVLRSACVQAVAWEQMLGLRTPVAVNVSVRQLLQNTFVSFVHRTLEESRMSGEQLELELTESVFIEDSSEILSVLQSLASLGVRLAVDDFGTRHALLVYLNRFPIGRLKIDRLRIDRLRIDRLRIDRLFVKDLPWDQSAAQIVAAIIALGQNLGCETVAEGVESNDQLEFLKTAGCDHVQGDLYGPPQAPRDVTALLQNGSWGLGESAPATRSFLAPDAGRSHAGAER